MDFRIDPELCVACLACVRVCPSDAVAVEDQKVWIVDEACTRVGLCLPACPHEAIIAVGDATRASIRIENLYHSARQQRTRCAGGI